jgi:serine/threonine protein kinase/formylglycine-generating enzyme required for sulfatase activity
MTADAHFEELLAQLPLPLAQLARRAHNAKTPPERHYAAFYLWEATLKLLASAAVIEYAEQGQPDPSLVEPLRKLTRPALGDWRGLLRLLLPLLAQREAAFLPLCDLLGGDRPRSDLPRLAGLDGLLREVLTGKAGGRSTVRVAELLDRLVEWRNRDPGHGAAGMREAAFYERTGPALLAGAVELLGGCDVLAGSRLALIDDVRRLGSGDWLVEWSLLSGEVPRRQESLTVPEAESGRLPRPGRVYLHRMAPHGGTWRELHPLVLFDPAGFRAFFLNARRGRRQAEYLCYTSGESEKRDDLGMERRALLARALGVPVGEADESAWATRSLAEEPAAAEEPPAPRRTVGEFELLSELGRGGMGIVYRAVQPSLGRQVALKVLGRLGDTKAEARFAREVRALGRVDHPHLVKVYTEGKDDLHWYFAMELIEGTDLAAVCGLLAGSTTGDLKAGDWDTAVSRAVQRQREQEKPISTAAAQPASAPPADGSLGDRPAAELGAGYVGRVVELVRQAARAAHALHEAGVVHRDVKPGNILVTADGTTAVLADLGLAQLADEAEGRLTRTRQFVGTPRYASPEQVLATSRVDRRTDVYSLGATLWELLALRPLLGATDETPTPEVFRRVQVQGPEKLHRLNPRVPRDLEAVVHKCLEKDADRRYVTAADLAADLGRWQRGEPVQAQPPALGYLLKKWARRHWAAVAGAAALLVVLVLGVAAEFWRISAAKDTADRLLAEAREANRRRVQAQVEQLGVAAPEALETILASLAEEREAVLPQLRELWAAAGGDRQRRMRAGLALLADDPAPVRPELARWLLEAPDPREVVLVVKALAPYSAELTDGLWRKGVDTATPAEERIRALAALAAFDPVGPGWKEAGPRAADLLLGANPLHLGTWEEALRPARAALLPALAEVFRGKRLAERRQVAATVLADYAADRPDLLADLAADAGGEQLAALLPALKGERDRVVPLLEKGTAPLAPAWPDAPLDAAWHPADPALVREVEGSGGLVAERFAFCQTLPLERARAVVAGLEPAGYRPERFRPFRADGKGKVAIVWVRDGKPFRLELGLTAAAVRARDADGQGQKPPLVPHDVAGYRSESGLPQYAGLWVRADAGEERKVLVGVADEDFHDAQEPLKKDFVPLTVQALPQGDKRPLYCSVWRKGSGVWSVRWRYEERLLRFANLDKLPLDVDVGERADWRAEARGEAAACLAAGPWLGLALASRPHPGPEKARGYAGVWGPPGGFDAERLVGLDPAAHLARCRALAEAGWRPAALSVAEVGGPDGPAVVAASLWHRPAIPEANRVARAARQAGAAGALLRLGRDAPVWPLLRHTPTPDVRSHLVARMAPLGVPARTVVERLLAEQDVSARRALILALGEYDSEHLPDDLRKPLVGRLLGWYRDDPDPGIHGSIDWLLRQAREGPEARKHDWKGKADLERIDRELAGKGPGGRRWFVNSQRQTFTVVPGPVEFVMGSPAEEPGHANYEIRHHRRIGRSFAIAAKAVTLPQWQVFLDANPAVKRYVGEHRKQYTRQPDCPIIDVNWYAAAMYCRWLSEQEKVPAEEMAVPSIEEILEAAENDTRLCLPAGYLSRTGYRLPTEAEFEYACRAESGTAWCFGGDEGLLPRYAWLLGNSRYQTWPPGQKRPNDLGLFDVHGNVWTWCQEGFRAYRAEAVDDVEDNRYIKDYLSIEQKRDLKYSSGRALRGGSFVDLPQVLRAAFPFDCRPAARLNAVGLRPARTYY